LREVAVFFDDIVRRIAPSLTLALAPEALRQTAWGALVAEILPILELRQAIHTALRKEIQ